MRGPVPARPVLVRGGLPARRFRAVGRPLDNRILQFRLLAILAAQLFDFATFTIMVERHGIGAELNPLVATSFHANGMVGLFAMKLALVVLVGSVTILLGRRAAHIHVPSRLATFITVLAVIGGVFGGWSNYITI